MKHFLAILCLPLLILTSCSSDDGGGPSTPANPPVFKATRLNALGESTAWSLPTATANINIFGIEITASKASTGETFSFILPNNGIGVYFSQNTDDSQGYTEYIPATGIDALTSVYPVNGAFTFVTITEIDTVNKKMAGTFKAGVYDEVVNTNFYFFDPGVFENIPYTEDIFIPGESAMGATVNGTVFIPVFTQVIEAANTLIISGGTISGDALQLSFPSNLAPGTYGLGLNSANPAHSGTYTTGITSAFANTGTLVITSNNAATSTVSGTFNFQASTITPPVVNFSVTAGTFTAEY